MAVGQIGKFHHHLLRKTYLYLQSRPTMKLNATLKLNPLKILKQIEHYTIQVQLKKFPKSLKSVKQRCRWVFKSGWASSNVVGIMASAPLVVIGLTELPNSGWAKAHSGNPLAASLNRGQSQTTVTKTFQKIESVNKAFLF